MKWIGWMLRLMVTIVMVSVLTIMTTGYVVHSYIQSILSSYNISLGEQVPTFSGMVKGMLGYTAGEDKESNQISASTPYSNSGQSQENEQKQIETEAPDVPEDALPVMGEMSSEAVDQQDQKVLVTPDDLVAKKDELTDKDKEEVFTILMSKLPQAEMQKLTEVMEGGLTETEMIEIEQILSKYLDKSEYAKMVKLLKE